MHKLSKKPHTPSNDEFASSFHLISGKAGSKVFRAGPLRFLTLLLFFLPLTLIILCRIHQKDERFVGGEVAVVEGVVGNLDLDLGTGQKWTCQLRERKTVP